jgi:hypothetical protein
LIQASESAKIIGEYYRRCFHEKARKVKGRRGDPNPN